MRKFLLEYLQQKLPLGNKLLKSLRCLHPGRRLEGISAEDIKYIAHQMPCTPSAEITCVVDEFKIYQLEKMPNERVDSSNEKQLRVDRYWTKVLSMKTDDGYLKYQHLGKVVKCALSLSHGQADNERSLSINKKLVQPERSALSDKAINGCRMTKDAVLSCGKEHDMPVDHAMLKACRSAHSIYKQHRDAEKRNKEEEKRKKCEQALEKKINQRKQRKLKQQMHDLEKEKKEIEQQWNELEKKLAYNKTVTEEAHQRMDKAIEENNVCAISAAHKLAKVAMDESNDLQEKTSALGKCKSDVFDKLQKATKQAKTVN